VGNANDDQIWGLRLDNDRIQVTIGDGDRGFKAFFADEAYRLAADLRHPAFAYELLGQKLDLKQREELASTIQTLLRNG
jgi:hypothetical protein